MTTIVTHIFLTIIFILLVGCNSANQKDTGIVKKSVDISVDTINIAKVCLKETFQQEDIPYNEYLAVRLKPIRENFKRINSISKWTLTDTMELNESTEGGEATFYYTSGALEKIVTLNLGETFQQMKEYYLLNGQLSFVFEKLIKFNRPIYYDSTSMKENSDNQAFELEKSEIEEDRSYFEKRKLIYQVNNQDCGSPFTVAYLLEEQKRIIADFEGLIKMKKL